MLNQIVLVGRLISTKEEGNKKDIVLEVERPFNEENIRKSDMFVCRAWGCIFNKIINFTSQGDLLAIKGRLINDNGEYIVMAENISLLNKKQNNILKNNNIWYSNYGDIMLHVGKYFAYIMRGAGAILFYPFLARKYIKNKDKYPLQERYDFVKGKVNRVFSKYLKVNLEVQGIENLDEKSTYLFVPNHQAMIDPLCLIELFDKPLIFVSKKEARKMPVFGKLNYIIDSIFLDRESPRDALSMVKACKNHLTNGTSVVIFPEGTRSKDEQVSILPYKPGALKCAYGTNAKIVPIVIEGSYLFLSIKRKNPMKTIKVKILKPISNDEYERLNTTELALNIETMVKSELEMMRKI